MKIVIFCLLWRSRDIVSTWSSVILLVLVHIKFVFGFLRKIFVAKGKIALICGKQVPFSRWIYKVNYTFYIFSWD